MDHVNNAVYATYLEQARAEFFRAMLDVSLTAVDTVLATLRIEYHGPIELGDTVTVALSIPELGDSSIPMEYEIRRDSGEVAATAETVQVYYDREAETSKPLPEEWRARLESV